MDYGNSLLSGKVRLIAVAGSTQKKLINQIKKSIFITYAVTAWSLNTHDWMACLYACHVVCENKSPV